MPIEYTNIIIDGNESTLSIVQQPCRPGQDFLLEHTFLLARSPLVDKYLCVGNWKSVQGGVLIGPDKIAGGTPAHFKPRTNQEFIISFAMTSPPPRRVFNGTFKISKISVHNGARRRMTGGSEFTALDAYVDAYSGGWECAYLFEGTYDQVDVEPKPERWDVME
jgi:hypothetical protein